MAHTADKFHHRMLQTAIFGILHGQDKEAGDLVEKSFALILLFGECFNYAVSGDCLMENIGDMGNFFLGSRTYFSE